MKRAIWVLLVVAAIAPLLFIECGTAYVWVGGYDLTVHIDCPTAPPAVVVCYPAFRREEAERICALSPTPANFEPDAAFADPFTGQPLKVRVSTNGRTSPSGRDLERSQPQSLVVVAVWRDDRRTCKTTDIPDGRKSKEMRVTIP